MQIRKIALQIKTLQLVNALNSFIPSLTIRKHIKQYEAEQPKIVEALRESLYVNYFISGACDVDEALVVTTTAKEILSHAGMNLCKWVTNSPDLRDKWTEKGVEHTADRAICGNVLKVVGSVWGHGRTGLRLI